MAEAILIIIFVIAFAISWYVILYMLKHPNINFHLESKVLAHEPNLDEKLTRIKVYLHSEEVAYLEEITTLLDVSEQEAKELLALLEFRGEVVINVTDEEIMEIKLF